MMSNFSAACPELVESGFFGVVAPPYYEVIIGKGKDARSTFIREASYLNQWCAEFILFPRIAVEFGSFDPRIKHRKADTKEVYRPMVEYIMLVGETLDNLSNELYTPPMVLESLARCTGYLERGRVRTDIIQGVLGCDECKYDEFNHILTISYGKTDFPIPLASVSDRMQSTILPILRRIGWEVPFDLKKGAAPVPQMDCVPYVTTLKTSTFDKTPMTYYQLYQVFKKALDLITLKVLKGLGSMASADMGRTCMNPETRRVYDIKSVGDVEEIFRLLGSDSEPRKQLVQAPLVAGVFDLSAL